MKRENSNKKIGKNYLLLLKDDLVDLSEYKRQFSISGDVSVIPNKGIVITSSSSYGNGSYFSFLMSGIGTNDFSIGFDFKLTQHSYYDYHIILSMGGSNTNTGLLGATTKGNSSAGWYANGNRIVRTGDNKTLNQWYHYTFERHDGLYHLYIDDDLIGTSTYNIGADFDNSANGGRTWWFGANQSASREKMCGILKNIEIKLL